MPEKLCAVAGNERLLARLRRGNGVGGTIPYLMTDEGGGLTTRDRLLVQRVRELLHAGGGAQHTAESLATALHMSTRSLHRQLRDEGAALQPLKDEVRRELAIERLRRTDRPVKQIALEAGFRNEKSFARAFRAWTGKSPSEVRARP